MCQSVSKPLAVLQGCYVKSMSTIRRSGFTIVEFLIVIVMIAILATISVVAYNGIQTRAKTTAWVAAVDNWTKILKL